MKTSRSGREFFRLGAESYSSLGRVGKKMKKILASTFGQIRLWTSFESSPVSVNLYFSWPVTSLVTHFPNTSVRQKVTPFPTPKTSLWLTCHLDENLSTRKNRASPECIQVFSNFRKSRNSVNYRSIIDFRDFCRSDVFVLVMSLSNVPSYGNFLFKRRKKLY